MGWIGAGEIILILILVFIFFGPKKLPEIGRLIGKGMREIRKASSLTEDLLDVEDEETAADKDGKDEKGGMEIPDEIPPSDETGRPDIKKNGESEVEYTEADYVKEAKESTEEEPDEKEMEGESEKPG